MHRILGMQRRRTVPVSMTCTNASPEQHIERIDVARVRRDTPGCEKVVHFNNAGASLMPTPVLEASLAHLQLEARIGGYEAAEEAQARHAAVYRSIAALLNASPEEIALSDSATRAWRLAFESLPIPRGGKILTTRAAYASNFIAFLHRARKDGLEIDVAPCNEAGDLDLDAFERRIDKGAALIALTHIPTNGGAVYPAEAVGRIARKHGVPYLLDACQSAGQWPLDVTRIGCDMLSATGRKFLRAPRGTGFLYVRRAFRERLEPPIPDLHSATWTAPDEYRPCNDMRAFEMWESSMAMQLGLGAAVDYALDVGLDAIRDRIQTLADLLRNRLRALPGVCVRDTGTDQCGVVTFDVARIAAQEIKARLREQSMHVTASLPSHTLLDAMERHLPDMVRASVHYYNTASEIDRFCDAISDISSRDA